MHGIRWVAIASLLGPAACANLWGFDTLISSGQGGGHDAGDDGASDADDAALDEDVVTPGSDSPDESSVPGGCNLANSGACRSHCAGDASPCGCLADDGTHTSYCGVTGSGISGASCASDTDCAPGYGCMASNRTCSHWCRQGTTVCPIGVCNTNASLIYDGADYGFCY
jgi:hypothetical protein